MCCGLNIALSACQKEDMSTKTDVPVAEQTLNLSADQSIVSTSYVPTVVGDTITNPYSMRIVRQAYKNLVGKAGFNASGLTLAVTDLHVRFMPRDSADEHLLTLDSTFLLSDVQLDRLVVKYGDGYRDPAVTEGQPTYRYTAVDIATELSKVGVPYVVLDSLYQPDAKDVKLVRHREALVRLEDAATALAKSKSPDYPQERRVPDWNPEARIRYLDDDGQLKGLEGANIHMNRWSKQANGFTDANGVYRADKQFNYEVTYKLVWERYQFAIKDSWLNRAVIEGPKQVGPWNRDINSVGDRDWRRAQVHRGAFRYYYQDILGLQRPPQNSATTFQMHYRVLDDRNEDALGRHCPFCQWLGFGSHIKIWVNRSGLAEAYIGTTIHETAHASHWNFIRSFEWGGIDEEVKESWARGVQFSLTRLHYSAYKPDYYKSYTGVVEDMLDPADGQVPTYFVRNPTGAGNVRGPVRTDVDFVSGYTIAELERALFLADTFGEWRDEIRARTPNATSGRLTELFNFWNTIPDIQ